MKIHLTVRAGNVQLLLDGQDITRFVSAHGFELDITEPRRPLVTLMLLPSELTIDGDVLVHLQHQALDELGAFRPGPLRVFPSRDDTSGADQ